MRNCDGAALVGRTAAVTRAAFVLSLLILLPGLQSRAAAQQIMSQPTRTVTIARGGSALLQTTDPAQRLSIADPAVADATAVSPREILVTGKTVGTTTLLLWDRNERVSMFSIVVAPDIGALQREIASLFPGTPVTLSASGSAIIISGSVRDPHTARRIIEVVRSSGATVIDNMAAPPQRQVMLHVRFAEVDRTVLSRLSADLFASNPQNLGQAIENPGFDPSTPGLRTPEIETLAEGIVRLFLIGNQGSSLEALIRALKTEGHFRSLAEPNLVALEGEEATFLAGGEFPFPTVQASGANGAVTIQWREFGVRLNFTPFVTNTGSIRLKVAPEVSSLDFANGLTISGFQIPALLSRKASTSIELRPGQHIAIAGLLDNSKLVEKSKIPILGDLPIIGAFFSSKSVRDRKTELLVIVTPHLVEPVDAPPALPTGETDTWDRKKFLKDPSMKLPAGVNIVPPSGGN
jgi:pilus assembly protein CpaC